VTGRQVACWHKADALIVPPNVRSEAKRGHGFSQYSLAWLATMLTQGSSPEIFIRRSARWLTLVRTSLKP
jgi:hypothetical protein